MPADPGWSRLLAAARRSLERTGGSLDGTISLSAPDDLERAVVIGVTGVHRPPGVARVTVQLAALDAHLRALSGVGLAETVGGFRDRPGERARENAARDAVLALAGSCVHAAEPWFGSWLAGLSRSLTRIVRSEIPFSQVIAVLDALPALDEPMPVLAERVLGDTKALADGPVRGLVMRALASWHALPVPAGAEQERTLWELAGVVPDDLASQVLVLNLPAVGGVLGSWLTSAASAHVPFRVTLQQLRLHPLEISSPALYVCENPAVLRAVAGQSSCPLVCTEGVPSAAVHALLGCAPTAVIHWRNDFDWTGVRLTAAALRRYPHAVPWRMSADDYACTTRGEVPLAGAAAATPWDPALAEAMAGAGQALMEERLLPRLLADLDS